MSDLDRTNNELVFAGSDGEPFTTSLVIAAETGNQHKSLRELIEDNLADLNEVGVVRFQTAKPSESENGGGRPTRYAELDEPAAALRGLQEPLPAVPSAQRAASSQQPAPPDPVHHTPYLMASFKDAAVLLTVEEVAERIAPDGVDKHMWTWRRMADGRIPGAIRIDRTHMLLPEAKLLSWMDSRTIEPVQSAPVVEEVAVVHGLSPRAARRVMRSA